MDAVAPFLLQTKRRGDRRNWGFFSVAGWRKIFRKVLLLRRSSLRGGIFFKFSDGIIELVPQIGEMLPHDGTGKGTLGFVTMPYSLYSLPLRKSRKNGFGQTAFVDGKTVLRLHQIIVGNLMSDDRTVGAQEDIAVLSAQACQTGKQAF